MLIKSLLLALLGAYGSFDYAIGTLYLNRPIFLCAMTGLVMGDFKAGIIMGGLLELFFMGAVSVGAYIPPDVAVGGILATAFSIQNGYEAEVALTIAMPLALLSLAIGNVITIISPFFLRLADGYAAKLEHKKVVGVQWFLGMIGLVRRAGLVFVGFYYGSDLVEKILEAIPEFVTAGMSAASGFLPALGFAMLMHMILTKQLLPYYFLGFALTSYLQVPALGVAIFAIVLILVKFGFLEPKTKVVETGGITDDEF